ncbi:2-hydroxyacid dehydrogenase [Reichenbachiella agarivorans]|uniref:2-hydroxyacid dehydrogenase n=1 Tax=Reichenbachiella agarivorans TaxID=2979464 RepID=A0ABY6CQX2_9BACT|nr:2-hydroxyacid dehydrogenase [Reichenbachiella agarivorans]UXP32917.1 2-hydroxyacid dehydrogenase [Reichenbachiella agarivorans]
MKVAIFSTKPYDKTYLDKRNKTYNHQLTYYEHSLDWTIIDLIKGFDAVCVFVNDHINAAIVQRLSENGIKIIALRCAGFNNVDLKACAKHHIKVVRVPAYSPESVAEHAMALILTLNRKTHKAYNRVREGNFSLDHLIGFNLYKRTVGVIGTGKIGAAFCRVVKGFGCEIVAYDMYPNEALKEIGVRYVSLDEVYTASDIISLHCPLTPETRHLISATSLSKMKKDVMIINTSRGALIHTQDIIQSLKKSEVGYLGLDVYEQEEHLFFEDLSDTIIEDDTLMRLISFPNVLITSHQAFLTAEALDSIADTVLGNLTTFERNEELVNEVKA